MSNSSEVIDYVYYPNNFTPYDAPEGVIPKYEFIIMPGMAALYNGIPERTNHNDPYNVWVVIIMFMYGTIGLLVNVFCVMTVIKNKTLSSSVKSFLLSDAGVRLYGCLMGFYQIECIFSWSCVDPSGYPLSWLLLNQILTTFDAALGYVTELLALGLSVNRVFAIYFDGLYYGKAQKMAIPSVLLAFLIPEALYLNFLGNRRGALTHVLFYTGYFYTPLQYLELQDNPKDMFDLWVTELIPWFGYGWIGLALLLDLCTLWKVRKMKKASSNSKSRADFKLSVMTTCSVLVIIAALLIFQMNNQFLISAEPFVIFLIGLPSYFFSILSGVVVAAFNYERKKSSRVLTQRPPGTLGNTATASSPHTHTTKIN